MNDYEFFEFYQRQILWLFNTRFGRWYFRIHNDEYSSLPRNKRIIRVYPHAIQWDNEDGSVTTEFRTNNRFAYRMQTLLKYQPFLFWETGYVPQLKFGLTVSTFNPNANPETTSVDGVCFESYVSGAGVTWATLIGGAGTSRVDGGTPIEVVSIVADSVTDMWRQNARGFFLFNTSPIGTDIVSAATLSLRGTNNLNDLGSVAAVNVFSSAPASNIALAAGDYDSVGTTPFSTSIPFGSWLNLAFNNFVLNASGIANINTIGISKFGTRDTVYDLSGTPPTWVAGEVRTEMGCQAAEVTGTTNDPKLVVTHAPSITLFNVMMID